MAYEDYQRWKTIPLTAEPLLSIIIPAYNEEERIIPTIGAVSSHVSGIAAQWEFIVVDDGSTD